jgi:orotidine-5'-phosphate decarboxylase
MTAIPRAERLIAALDVPSATEAKALVEKLGDAVRFYKIGLELFSADGYFELLAWLTARGNKVFADLKLYDIPETVRRAVANLRGSGATFVTVHGHRSIMEAAAREKGAMKILAVTVLTSFDQRDLDEMGSRKSLEELVLARARGAAESGCDGVIASGHEAQA